MKRKIQLFLPLLFCLFLFNSKTTACTSFNLDYTFTTAAQGETVTVTWTSGGCAAGSLVYVSLIDNAANATVLGYDNLPNTGSFDFPLDPGQTPGMYRFYIHFAPTWPPDAWDNGPDFEILAPTPVELVAFTGKLIDRESIELNWQTASEINNEGFEIEYSTNGMEWTVIDFLEGAGESQFTQAYQFIHETPEGEMNYYRLKQLDFNGLYEYSSIVSVKIRSKEGADIKVYPNPFVDHIILSDSGENPYDFQLVTALGEVVVKDVVHSNQIDLSKLGSGVYRLMLFSNGKVVSQHNIFKW